MTTYTFQTYPATATAKFDCPSCGKKNRTRTFRAECTVNPFNKNEDGTIKTPSEVRMQSSQRAVAERNMFMRKPMCATCENDLTYQDRKLLREQRAA